MKQPKHAQLLMLGIEHALNRMVCSKIMGWTLVKEEGKTVSTIYRRQSENGYEFSETLPQYAIDLNLALQVAEEIHGRLVTKEIPTEFNAGCLTLLFIGGEELWLASFNKKLEDGWWRNWHQHDYSFAHDSAAFAICHAAIELVETVNGKKK
jgi:hypothetical protein